MIYTCQTKGCHYLFLGNEGQAACPDCGKRNIRPATMEERTEFFRRRTEALTHIKQSG